MLKKLLKYEVKATGRIFLPLYAALLAFAAINKIANPIEVLNSTSSVTIQAFISMLSIFVYIGLIVGIGVVTLIITIQRFYTNLLGDEGYLMFTLPVEAWKLIVSKLLVAILWFFLSILMVISSIFILVDTGEAIRDISIAYNQILEFFGATFFIIFPVLVFVMLGFVTLMIYNSIAVGHLTNKSKLIASFGMYCVFYSFYQFLMVGLMLIFSLTIFNSMFTSPTTPQDFNIFFITIIVITSIQAVGHFFFTKHILKKKLNLS